MADVSPASALRKIQQAQAGLKKARQAMKLARGDSDSNQRVIRVGWAALTQALRILSEIPLEAADETVMTKQLASQRYATSLLVRLRRLARNETGPIEADDDDDFGDDEE